MNAEQFSRLNAIVTVQCNGVIETQRLVRMSWRAYDSADVGVHVVRIRQRDCG
jgi:hypothetical protein